jgi:ATP-binding cassette subfamily B protein
VVLGALAYAAGLAVYAETEVLSESLGAAAGSALLGALAGPTPIRTHGAERGLLLRQEDALVVWLRAARRHARMRQAFGLLRSAITIALAVALAFRWRSVAGPAPGILLVIYWAAVIDRRLTGLLESAAELPRLRLLVTFLLEPLTEIEGDDGRAAPAPERPSAAPVALALVDVRLAIGGLTVLEGLDLDIPAGSEVAVVGASGAGKTSLAGLLLGWLAPSSGRILLDGAPVTAEALAEVRRRTVWIDPAVQLWNRSLVENVEYGSPATGRPTAEALADALLDGMEPEGALGENGSRLSGGEGQRVRFARGLKKGSVGLVVLDEAFRGLDEPRRKTLLARARARWAGATFVCISHDIEVAASFPRVLVLEGGKIVEDGAPAELAARPDSAFAARARAERAHRDQLFSGTGWRSVAVRDGQIGTG